MNATARPTGFRPPLPIEVAAPYRWPPKAAPILRWLFGFPGYLWPWLVLFAGLAWINWYYLTPEVQQLQTLRFGWIASLYCRNLVLLFAFVAPWHYWLYRKQAQGSEYKYDPRWPAAGDPRFLFGSQLWDNIFRSVCSAVPIWTAYEASALWLWANGKLPSVSWNAHPVYSWLLLLLVIPVWLDIHFYSTHRLLHWKPLYSLAHYVHHKNINVTPWSGVAMHPIEHAIYFSPIMLLWLIPATPVHYEYLMLLTGLGASLGHIGFSKLKIKTVALDIDDYAHFLHHKYVTINFGSTVAGLPLDRWLGTFYDGSGDLRSRTKRSEKGQAEDGSRKCKSVSRNE